METELRVFFYNKLGGFSDKRYKNISLDKPFSLSDYSYDVNDHATYVFLNVIDNTTLKISFSNNIQNNFPKTKHLDSFLQNYEGEVGQSQIKILFNVDDTQLLTTLRKEFIYYYSDSPNYVWVKERIVEAIDKLIDLLYEYNDII